MVSVIYTSIVKPVGVNTDDATAKGSAYEHIHPHLTRYQDVFGIHTTLDHWVLDLIATNTRVPSVVLHWPSMEQLVDEVREQQPEYVAIPLTAASFPRAERMTESIKKASHATKVVYGGYPPEQGSADVLLKGEGVSAMWELLGEENKRIVHPLFTAGYSIAGISLGPGSGIIYEKVGCNNDCDFCSTSAYHDSAKYLLSVDETADLVERYMKKGIRKITLFNEDHLRNAGRNRKLHSRLDQAMEFMAFSCMDSIQQYSPEELFAMGYNNLWVGVEDFSSRYGKNDYEQLDSFVEDMRTHGIPLIVSGIIGDPDQSREECQQTLDRIINLGGYANQFIIKMPLPGTAFHRKAKVTVRDYRHYDGHHLLHRHPTIPATEMEKMQVEAQVRDYFRNGPSFFRNLEVVYEGCKTFRGSRDGKIERRVESNVRKLRESLPLVDVVINRHPNLSVRERAKEFRARVIEEFGLPIGYGVKKRVAGMFALYESGRLALEEGIPALTRQPKFRKECYNC